MELALYLVYMACFAGFCMAGRGSCPPPETLAEDFQSFSGASAPGFRLCICPKKLVGAKPRCPILQFCPG